LIVAIACTSALAGDIWPGPKENWWEELKGGESATFDMTFGSDIKMKLIIEIVKVEGTMITFTTKTFLDGDPLPENTQTVDAKGKEAGGQLPSEATVLKIEDKTFQAGDKTFDCTEYSIEVNDVAMKVCHSRQLPAIFSGGNVTLETEAEGTTTTFTLKEYNGKMLK
jgi:hypothetical protein